MEVIGVSACLLGIGSRYDGKSKVNENVLALKDKYILVPLCPEIYGGLPTPRHPGEIVNNKVINEIGEDISENYYKGARETLKICKINGIKIVILKSKSPSCGKGQVYDGTFSRKLVQGNGIACQLLMDNGIKVLREDEIQDL